MLCVCAANSKHVNPEHYRCFDKFYLSLLLPFTLRFEPYLQKHCLTTCFPGKLDSYFYLLGCMCQRKTLLSQFCPALMQSSGHQTRVASAFIY